LGIFGGAFNPPHIGHLVCAQEAHAELGLDSVLWVPVGEAPHREIEADPGAELRARMCEQAVGGDDRFEISRIEVDRAGPSYTVDTLRDLHARESGDELFLILGGDSAAALPTWREPEEVLRLATVAVAEREELRREKVRAELQPLEGGERTVFFDMPRVDVSSTLIRGRVRRGQPIRYLVPDAVAGLIAQHALYGAAAPVAGGSE
jgi:nicotinate-nucleotide adenylyltransferase